MSPSSSDYHDDCDNYNKENDYSIIIKDGHPELAVITGDMVSGTTFTVGNITLNTSSLNNLSIKIDFVSNIFSIDFSRDINFRVFKFCNNQSSPIPVGEEWIFSTTGLTNAIFSFFVYDSDSSNNGWCTYTVVATIK
ncbi:DUF4489 domain-containing protein [Clostridium sp. AL.422]|uniref:DUF4489 domain-containing protein n=1 Tax=Clostridium TaxID=1485 RepID=UPI00293DA852|nr:MULTISPECIES: DUF4489 domain-containing protein [unclassified Clostridium]MDV4151845.1 DUF4489 domain-containing protein [Clostridium sp. AL.422]